MILKIQQGERQKTFDLYHGQEMLIAGRASQINLPSSAQPADAARLKETDVRCVHRSFALPEMVLESARHLVLTCGLACLLQKHQPYSSLDLDRSSKLWSRCRLPLCRVSRATIQRSQISSSGHVADILELQPSLINTPLSRIKPFVFSASESEIAL